MSNSPFRKPVLPKGSPEASDPRWKRWKMHDFAAPRRPLRPRIEADEQSSSAASSAAARLRPKRPKLSVCVTTPSNRGCRSACSRGKNRATTSASSRD